jgi:N-acetylneuraminic acid mutarotase
MKRNIIYLSIGLVILLLFAVNSTCFAQANTWTKKADMPTPRSNISSTVLNGKIIVAGGMLQDFSSSSAVEEYDPKTDAWVKKGNMTTARDTIAVGVINGKFYAIGGIFGCDEPTPLVEEYDPATDKWTKKADMPTARLLASASIVNGKIYVIGGSIGHGDQNCSWWSGVSTVEEYDPATDKWTKKTDMPTARACLSTCAVNGKIYAIGGFSFGLFSMVEEYDPITDKWTKKKDMPTKRCNFAAATVNGRIYAIGGEAGNFSSILEEYDPIKDEWTQKADMPTGRSKIACSAVNGKLYVIGGYTEQSPVLSLVEAYDTGFSDATTSVKAEGKMPLTWAEIKIRY